MKYFIAGLLVFSGFALHVVSADTKPQSNQVMLYYSSDCPHCKKVVSYVKSNGIKVPMTNADGNEEAQATLQKVGGYNVVPCLVVNGQAIYDSNNIIAWLSENQRSLSK